MTPAPSPRRRLDDPDPPCLGVSQVAALTGLSASLIRDLSDEGAIACLRIPRGRETVRVYRRSWVEAFLAAHTTGPAAAKGVSP